MYIAMGTSNYHRFTSAASSDVDGMPYHISHVGQAPTTAIYDGVDQPGDRGPAELREASDNSIYRCSRTSDIDVQEPEELRSENLKRVIRSQNDWQITSAKELQFVMTVEFPLLRWRLFVCIEGKGRVR